MLFLKRIFGTQKLRAEAARSYATLAAQARQPRFYSDLGVPDSIDGRFEMLCVHAHALFHRLRGQGEKADHFAQAVYDAMFSDLDGCLREMGVADLGVGRRIKIMTEALKGRIHAYDAALAERGAAGEEALCAAIRRNVFGTVTPGAAQVAAMAGYMRALNATLADCALADLLTGQVRLPQVPEIEA